MVNTNRPRANPPANATPPRKGPPANATPPRKGPPAPVNMGSKTLDAHQLDALMGKLNGKKTAASNAQGVWFHLGVFQVSVRSVKMTVSHLGDPLFIVRFGILQSSIPELHPVGSFADWCANFRHPSTPDNIARFLSAVLGVQLEQIEPSHGTQALDQNGEGGVTLLSGMEVFLTTSQIGTRAGGTFTLHTFTPTEWTDAEGNTHTMTWEQFMGQESADEADHEADHEADDLP